MLRHLLIASLCVAITTDASISFAQRTRGAGVQKAIKSIRSNRSARPQQSRSQPSRATSSRSSAPRSAPKVRSAPSKARQPVTRSTAKPAQSRSTRSTPSASRVRESISRSIQRSSPRSTTTKSNRPTAAPKTARSTPSAGRIKASDVRSTISKAAQRSRDRANSNAARTSKPAVTKSTPNLTPRTRPQVDLKNQINRFQNSPRVSNAVKKATEAAQKSNRTNIPNGIDRNRLTPNDNRQIDVRSTVKNLSKQIPAAKAKDLNSLRRDLQNNPGEVKSRLNQFTRDMRQQNNITGKQARDLSKGVRNLTNPNNNRPSYLDPARRQQVQKFIQKNVQNRNQLPGVNQLPKNGNIRDAIQNRRPNVSSKDISRIVNQYRNRGQLPGINVNRAARRLSVAERRNNLSTRLRQSVARNISNVAVNSAINNSVANNINVNASFNNWRRFDRRFNRFHRGWHRGFWPTAGFGYWRPGFRWNFWVGRYPVFGSFGFTPWNVNRAGYAFGYYNYNNPYCYAPTYVNYGGYDYTQPIIVENYSSSTQQLSDVPVDVQDDRTMAAFNYAQQQFYTGDYNGALESINKALEELPNDAVLHEFRALVLFALGDYQTAAATLYPVLSVGPGWNWSTMNSLYPNVAEYTKHLRALEDYRTANPNDAAARFVLSYQYITCGHKEAAIKQLKKLIEIAPDDRLAPQLLTELDEDAEVPSETPNVVPPQPEKPIDSKPLIGSWKAKRDNDEFAMTLKDDGKFEWTFTRNGQEQKVTGVWSVNEKGILAMEMDDETVMLSQVVPDTSGGLDFYMLGDTQEEKPLKFRKAQQVFPTPPPVP